MSLQFDILVERDRRFMFQSEASGQEDDHCGTRGLS